MVALVLARQVGRCLGLEGVVVLADGRWQLALVRIRHIARIRPNRSKSCPTDHKDPSGRLTQS